MGCSSNVEQPINIIQEGTAHKSSKTTYKSSPFVWNSICVSAINAGRPSKYLLTDANCIRLDLLSQRLIDTIRQSFLNILR